MPVCLGPDLPTRMLFALRCVAVVLHAISGVFLSILALILQHFIPSLKQIPPSFYFDHTSDLSHHHLPRRRDSSDHSSHSITSDSASDESSEPRLSISEPDPNDDHFALLLASQARARAARHPFALSSSLWTLKEYPSPYLSQVGEGHGSTAIPPDRLCDSPSIASSGLSTPPHEEGFSEKSRKSSTTSKHSRSGHGHPFRLLPFHRRGSRSLSPLPPGQSRHNLPEADTPPRRASSSSRNEQDHYRSSVLDYVRRVAPGNRDNKGKKRKAESQLSAPRVGRGRTDPYQAPYFFPSPMSPGAYDYARLAQHNRKPVSSDTAYTPMSTENQLHPKENERTSSPSRGRLRSVWPPLHRRSSSHS